MNRLTLIRINLVRKRCIASVCINNLNFPSNRDAGNGMVFGLFFFSIRIAKIFEVGLCLFLSLSCAVHQAEASRPPAVIRWRRSWRKPGRWLPGHCYRGVAPAALPSTVWPEGSQWGRAGADWRLPQNTLSRYEGLLRNFYCDQLNVLWMSPTELLWLSLTSWIETV